MNTILGQTIPQFARDVARNMTDWTVKQDEADRDWCATLTHPSGASLFIRNGGREQITIYGRNAQGSYSRSDHKMGINPARGAAVVAKEIARRLLPDYMKDYAQQAEQVRQWQARHSEANRKAEELGAVLGTAASVKENYIYYYTSSGERSIFLDLVVGTDGDVRIESGRLTLEMARRVCHLVKEA